MASNIDTTLAEMKGTVTEVRYSSLPAVRSAVTKAGYHVDTLARSLQDKLTILQRDITRLTGTANGSIGKLTDSTASTMASLQLRIDLLLEEIRMTTAQLRKTANGVGADIRNVVK
jgi:phage host-nuclease inhibitor protein Gam